MADESPNVILRFSDGKDRVYPQSLTNFGSDQELTDEDMQIVADALPHLQTLHIHKNKLTAEGFKHIAKLKDLELLYVDYRDYFKVPDQLNSIDKEALLHLDGLRNLKNLEFNSVQLSGAACEHIAKHTALEKLHLANCSVSAKGLASLATLPNLIEMNLQGQEITDEKLKSVAQFKNLKGLFLAYTKLENVNLQNLKECPALESIRFQGAELSEQNLIHLSALPHLKTISIPYTEWENQDAPVLKELVKQHKKVTGLDLEISGAPVFKEAQKLRDAKAAEYAALMQWFNENVKEEPKKEEPKKEEPKKEEPKKEEPKKEEPKKEEPKKEEPKKEEPKKEEPKKEEPKKEEPKKEEPKKEEPKKEDADEAKRKADAIAKKEAEEKKAEEEADKKSDMSMPAAIGAGLLALVIGAISQIGIIGALILAAVVGGAAYMGMNAYNESQKKTDATPGAPGAAKAPEQGEAPALAVEKVQSVQTALEGAGVDKAALQKVTGQAILAADTNGNKVLDASEISKMLSSAGVQNAPAEQALKNKLPKLGDGTTPGINLQ